MGINLNKWNKTHESDSASRRTGGGSKEDRLESWNMREPGKYIGYLIPPQEHMDELPFVRYFVHKTTPRGPKWICLEHEMNVALFEREDVQEAFATRKSFDLKVGDCPIEYLQETSPDLLGEMKGTYQYLMLFIPWAKIVKRDGQLVEVPLPEAERVPSWVWAGSQIFDGLHEVISEQGDVSDPDHGTLIQIHVTGKTPDWYKVTAYKPSGNIKNATPHPFRLPKPQRFAIDKVCGPGKPGDPILFFARMVKDNQTILDHYRGTSVREEEVDGDSAGRPSCFAEKAVFDKDDADCKACPAFKDCAAACGVSLDAKPEKPAKAKPKPPPEPEPEEDEEEDEPEPQPEPPKAKAKPAKAKPAPKPAPEPEPEPEEEEADSDDDDFASALGDLVD